VASRASGGEVGVGFPLWGGVKGSCRGGFPLRHGGEGDSDDGEKYEDHGDSEGCGGWWVKHIIYLQIHAVRLVHVDSGCIAGSSQVFSPIFRRSSERRGA